MGKSLNKLLGVVLGSGQGIRPDPAKPKDEEQWAKWSAKASDILEDLKDPKDYFRDGKWRAYQFRTVARLDPLYLIRADALGDLNKHYK